MININTNYAFMLTVLSGSATIIGMLPIFFKFKDRDFIIITSLGFASGVMLSASVFDLIPESLNYFLQEYQNMRLCIILLAIFFVMGILISSNISNRINYKEDSLYKVGLSSMIAIIIHNLPEGIITFLSTTVNKSLGFSLFLAITLHNIPEGFSIAVPIYYSTNSKFKAFLYCFLAALSEPIGAFIAFLFLKDFITNFLLGIFLSLIAGIMTSISIYELLPESFNYKRKKISIVALLIGLIFMYISIKLT